MSISTTSSMFRSSSDISHEPSVVALDQNEVGLLEKFRVYESNIDSYLSTFVPSGTPCPLPHPAEALSSKMQQWMVQKAGNGNYDLLLSAFDELVSDFPVERKLSFYKSHKQAIPFPITAFASEINAAHPDIAVSFPGQALPSTVERPSWSNFSMAIEVKAALRDHPFYSEELECATRVHYDSLVQLAVSAEGLMAAHGFLATFALGIYGGLASIVRFDHSCAVVSQPFFIWTPEGLRTLQEFFWNFVHPWEGPPGSVVGADTTIRSLSSDDQSWLKGQLGARASELLRDVKLDEGRRAKVWDQEDPSKWRAFLLFKPLSMGVELFWRSTTVWLGIEDTRVPDSHADRADDSEGPALCVIKDAWGELCRTSEDKFYARLEETIAEEEWCGLPRMLCGCDMGARDVARWQAARDGQPWAGDDDLLKVPGVASAASSGTPSAPPCCENRPSSNTSSASSGKLEGHHGSTSTAPTRNIPHPMHQTYSSRLTNGEIFYERSHVRLVVDTVGRPLSRFRSTKEMVMAMRDAIVGHRLAWERGGILHKDISSGNILIVESPREHPPSRGVLHDFNLSSMTPHPPGKGPLPEDTTAAHFPKQEDKPEPLADGEMPTGTYYFISIRLMNRSLPPVAHDFPHDLESFYWVLLWIILRHTAHSHPRGALEACGHIFVLGDAARAELTKRIWLIRDAFHCDLAVAHNPPLTALFTAFHMLVYDSLKWHWLDYYEPAPLTYDAVLALFDAAIARDDWPVGDKAIPFGEPPEPATPPACVTVAEAGLDAHTLPDNDNRPNKRPREDDDYDDAQSGAETGSASATLCSAVSGRAAKRARVSGLTALTEVWSDPEL